MVRLQFLSRNMTHEIPVQQSCNVSYNEGSAPSGIRYFKTEPQPLPPHHDNHIDHIYVPSAVSSVGLASAGMSTGHNGNSSGNQQHYCLRWNNHQHNLLGVLESVLTSQQYADVSLFCEGQVIRVHKLVLLASSTHFERILEATPVGQQPVIILDGTRISDLRALVDYMYRGEVNIEQDQLPSLLKTAENLKIKGLVNVANKEEEDRGGGITEDRDDFSRAEGSNSIGSSPPIKRPKISPADSNCPSSSRDKVKDIRDLRELPQAEPRDFSRDGTRELTREISNHFGIVNNGGYTANRRRSHSPNHPLTTADSIVKARNLFHSSTLISKQSSNSPMPNLNSVPYMLPNTSTRSRSPHPAFDPAPGSSLHPSRNTPPSPTSDSNKIASAISMSPFGLPFSLPMLHDSKKLLDRSSTHKMLPSPYDVQRDDREKDYHPPTWPPRGADLDTERERDRNIQDRELDREWDRDKTTERIQLAYHQQLHQDPISQQHLILQQQLQKKIHDTQPTPISLPKPSASKLPKLEIIDKDGQDLERRITDEKFSASSPEKDTSFSPPDEKQLLSLKADYTNEVDPVEEDEDSSNQGSIRDGPSSNSNGDITSTITSTTNSVARPPSGTSATPATTSGESSVKCPYCPRSYRHQNNLRTHIRCFHKGVRIPCPICRRGFTRWFTVRCHIAREHQNFDFTQPERLPAQLRRALYPPYNE